MFSLVFTVSSQNADSQLLAWTDAVTATSVMSQLLHALLASRFHGSMQGVVISLHFVFTWDCTRSDDNQTQTYGWGSVLFWLTLFTSLIEEESSLLVMLLIKYIYSSNVFIWRSWMHFSNNKVVQRNRYCNETSFRAQKGTQLNAVHAVT